jgi:hypothetical protein
VGGGVGEGVAGGRWRRRGGAGEIEIEAPLGMGNGDGEKKMVGIWLSPRPPLSNGALLGVRHSDA